MDDQRSLETIERPLCALIAQDSRLPECYDHWDLPESYEHWDLPEVYIPVVINNQQAIVQYRQRSLLTLPDEKLSSPRGSCWKRHWTWLLLVAILLVGGAAGGGIAGALLSRRQQDNDASVVPRPSTVSTTISGALADGTSSPGVSQPHGATKSDAEFDSAGGMKTISATQAVTVTSESKPQPTETSLTSLPSNTQVPNTLSGGLEPTDTRATTGKGSDSTKPAEADTHNPTPLPAPNPSPEATLGESPKPTAEPSPSPNSPQANPLLKQPSKPTRAIHIGRAARAGEVNDILEIAFSSDNPCDYTVIGTHGDWVCDTPFLIDETVYQWKGCGSYTWLVWGPTQERFGNCTDSPTTRASCHGLVAFGIWLCSPE
ncbi:hypothetical protein QBC36DRAFT_245635 [Triangularia setosa]|uniref:Uncharacterized protein n=1 Tax=Triangularia setosa TaxID=2587417 RepID=A0AAN7A4W7_9PEZI|nr:hypothetical protein QBC36DRAFT_245635 [Podospora setosa]